MTRDARNALIRAHQNNIDRYCRLLATELTAQEREYVHKRITEERTAMDRLLILPDPEAPDNAKTAETHVVTSTASP
jgi:hypothetical protein